MKAIIYIPGIAQGSDFAKTSLETYAYKYKKALDLANEAVSNTHFMRASKFQYGKGDQLLANSAVIGKITADGSKEEVCEIFELEYMEILINRYNKKNAFSKLFTIFTTISANAFEIVRSYAIRGKRKSFKNTIQLLYMATMMLIIVVTGLLILPALLDLVLSVLHVLPNGEEEGFIRNVLQDSPNLKHFLEWFSDFSKIIIAASLTVAVFIPNFRSFFSDVTSRILGMNKYLLEGREKLNITGKLETLIEKVVETREYSTVEIHGYSLGSIITLDTLFPYGSEPSKRVVTNVNTIVTIGCFYDFIVSFLPNYFEGRKRHSLQLSHWYNVYSKVDVISSNFNSKVNNTESEYGIVDDGLKPINIPFEVINSKSLGFFSYMRLIGLRAHDMYWGDEPDGKSCLMDLLLKQAWQEKQALP